MFFCNVKFRSLRIHCSDVFVFYSQWSLRSSPFQCENSYRCVPVALNFLPTIHSAVLLISSDWKEKLRKKFGFCLPWIYYIQLCAPMCTVKRNTPLQFRHNGTQKNEIKKCSFRIFNILFCVGVELLPHPSECRNINGNCGNSYTASNPMQWYILFRSLISLSFASSAFRFSASIANLAKCRKKKLYTRRS